MSWQLQGILVEQEQPLLVPYKEIEIHGQRIDLWVGRRIIVESKCVEDVAPIHLAQLISYLKTAKLRPWVAHQFQGAEVEGWNSAGRRLKSSCSSCPLWLFLLVPNFA
jgi:GxxExxY protein